MCETALQVQISSRLCKKKKSTATKPHKMQDKHTGKVAKCDIKYIFVFQHQPVYWMILITAAIPVIEVMEAILATEIWVVPVVHCHSLCFWPVRIISPARKNVLILVKIMPFDIVPCMRTRRRVIKFKRELKNPLLNTIISTQPAQADETAAGSAVFHLHPLWLLALPAVYVVRSPHRRPTFLFVAELLVLAPQLFPFPLDAILFSPPLVFYVHPLSFQSLSFHPFPFKALPLDLQPLPSDLQPLPFLPLPDGLQVLLPLPALACAVPTQNQELRS